MIRRLLTAIGIGLAAFSASAELTWGSASAVGTAESTSGANPYVGLVDRGDGTFALVFTNAQETTFTFNSPWKVKEFLVVGGGGAGGFKASGAAGGHSTLSLGDVCLYRVRPRALGRTPRPSRSRSPRAAEEERS